MKLPAQIVILALSIAVAGMIGYALAGKIGYALAPREAPGSVLVVNGQEIPIPPDSEVTLEVWESDQSEQPIVIHDDRGRAKGADLSTTVDSFASSFQVAAPELEMNGSRSTAGEVAYKAKSLAAKGHIIILFFGLACVIGGVVCAVKWDPKLGTYVAGAGLVLILVGVMLERFPWVALLLPLVGIGLVVYFWWRARQGKRTDVTLDSVLEAVDKGVVAAEEKVGEFVAKNVTNPVAKIEVVKRTN